MKNVKLFIELTSRCNLSSNNLSQNAHVPIRAPAMVRAVATTEVDLDLLIFHLNDCGE